MLAWPSCTECQAPNNYVLQFLTRSSFRRLFQQGPCLTQMQLLPCVQTNTHFESGLGVAIQGQMAPGPVTLLRIGGKILERLWLEEGHIVEQAEGEASWSPHLCRTQVRLRREGIAG
jgi:hypothetical protein